ncbi:MAG: sigma 54-interacting transcriptional regulator [Bradymonadia bacterium]
MSSALHESATELTALARLAGNRDHLDELFRRGLDWLCRIARYDLATIFMLEGERLTVKAARGKLALDQVKDHTLDLSAFPTLAEALETRRARAFTEGDHRHGDGDPFDGVLDLPPGHACMVVPLCAGERRLGLLTLDRDQCEPYPQSLVDQIEIYGHLLALAILNAEQSMRLEQLLKRTASRARILEDEAFGQGDQALSESRSPAVQEMVRRARLVAQTDTPVLIRGETGTGKERLAAALHRWSARKDAPFVRINCAAIPANLLEAELFGHVKGAFTGAHGDRPGRFQVADGGTLLLDEIGELPLALQAKLLRVLQEGTLEPVGSDSTITVDVRIFAATHVDLEQAITDGRFREDLYYRLNVFPLHMPPLRERLEDLPLLSEILLADQARRTRRTLDIGPDALSAMSAYDWPGNLRELANLLERASILSPGPTLTPSCLGLPTGAGTPRVTSPLETEAPLVTLEEAQRLHIARALDVADGRIYGPGGAAELLDIKPTTLQSRMKKLGVSRR